MEITLTLIVLILAGLLCLEKAKTVKITDEAPEDATPKNCWLKLQNEGMKYVKVKDGKVTLKIKE